MICSTCNKDANDHHVAYYDVGGDVPVWKCWTCLSVREWTVLLDASLSSNWKLKQNARRGVKMLRELGELK